MMRHLIFFGTLLIQARVVATHAAGKTTAAATKTGAERDPKDRPNFVLFFVDDLGVSCHRGLGCWFVWLFLHGTLALDITYI